MMHKTLSEQGVAPNRHGPGTATRDAAGVVAPHYLYYYADDAPPPPPWWAPGLRWFNAIGGDVLFLAALAYAVALICTTPIATA